MHVITVMVTFIRQRYNTVWVDIVRGFYGLVNVNNFTYITVHVLGLLISSDSTASSFLRPHGLASYLAHLSGISSVAGPSWGLLNVATAD